MNKAEIEFVINRSQYSLKTVSCHGNGSQSGFDLAAVSESFPDNLAYRLIPCYRCRNYVTNTTAVEIQVKKPVPPKPGVDLEMVSCKPI